MVMRFWGQPNHHKRMPVSIYVVCCAKACARLCAHNACEEQTQLSSIECQMFHVKLNWNTQTNCIETHKQSPWRICDQQTPESKVGDHFITSHCHSFGTSWKCTHGQLSVDRHAKTNDCLPHQPSLFQLHSREFALGRVKNRWRKVVKENIECLLTPQHGLSALIIVFAKVQHFKSTCR